MSHEHSNQNLQARSGGLVVDIYDEDDTIALYILAASDALQLIVEFEKVLDFHDPSVAHHEKSPALQMKFMKHVWNLVTFSKTITTLF